MKPTRLIALLCWLGLGVVLLAWGAIEHPAQARATQQDAPAAPFAPNTTVALTPTQDLYLDSTQPQSRFDSQDLIVGATAGTIGDWHTLLRFDLQPIPAGSIINKAVLRLNLTKSSGALGWTITARRITSAWAPATVTWVTKPASTIAYASLPVPDSGNQIVTWDISDLVKSWAYGDAANLGLELTPGNRLGAQRIFSSREGVDPPQLLVDFTPPPSAVQLPEVTGAIKLDANCEGEYAQAASFSYIDRLGAQGRVYLQHDAANLYICINAPLGRDANRFFGLYFDTDRGQEKYPEAEDLALEVAVQSGTQTTLIGTGEPSVPYKPAPELDGLWQSITSGIGNTDSAEFIIPRKLFARSCTTPFGLAVYHRSVLAAGDDYGLPAPADPNSPLFWLETSLANPDCIRVCSEQAVPCGLAAGARVRNARTGAQFTVDAEGYVQNREQIALGDPLWALWLVDETGQALLYHTSGEPQAMNRAAFRNPVNGVMTLVVSKDYPLLIQDLTVSAQWYVQGDPARAARLQRDLDQAADFFYAFTDGQFVLGDVRVQQTYDGWDTANLKLHINNNFQPRAVVGGIVFTDTADFSPTVPISYTPGSIYMGSYWNRFGTPPGQEVKVDGVPVPPSTLQADWSLALAHELGHYLLYLYDTYTGVDGKASADLAKLCTSSAMGDVYAPGNHGFIFDPQHWQQKCSQTEAYHTLAGRTEWATIQGWYPWTIVPTKFISGPVAPAGLTTVTFITPTTPPGLPATSQTFALDYVDKELTSGEARVFLFRNDERVLEQGKPPKGINQVNLIDAQVGDRLCVYDLNDYAENSETPRHQFGCETIVLNDANLPMTKDSAWEPLISLRQVGANQLAISVTQSVSAAVSAPILARIYPEHGTLLMTETLTAVGNVYRGQFNLPVPVPPAYVQLWVDETPAAPATRREVMVDRGTGGSGAFGPAKRLSGVFITSSDGDASYENETLTELGSGESVVWQSMPSTPPLPPGTQISGQSYQLDAFPATLVLSGTVSIQHEELVGAVQSARVEQAGQATPAIYFWNGQNWQPLATALTTPVNASDGVKLAAAASQGIGVYAVLFREPTVPGGLFLPIIQR